MAAIYLHDHQEFPDLLRMLEEETGILSGLVEKGDKEIRLRLQKRYELTRALYYKGQPSFNDILDRIYQFIDKL